MLNSTTDASSAQNEGTLAINEFKYKFGVSLMKLNVNTCPVEVFRPQCNYYQSLNSSIASNKKHIENLKKKLKLIHDVDGYVEERFDSVHDEKVMKANEQIKELQEMKISHTTSLCEDDVEEEIERCQQYIQNLPEHVTAQLKREYFKLHNVSPDSIYYIEKEMVMCKNSLDDSELELIEWKQKSLEEEKEEERKQLIAFLGRPHNVDDIIKHLNEFVHRRITEEFAEILDCYYTMYENRFEEMTRNKYAKTLKSVFDDRSSKKVMTAFNKHNKLMATRLGFIISKIRYLDLGSGRNEPCLTVIEETVKKSFETFIDSHFTIIYDFLRASLKSSSDVSFDSAVAAKKFALGVVQEMNECLIDGLPGCLNSRFDDYIADLQEEYNINVGMPEGKENTVGEIVNDFASGSTSPRGCSTRTITYVNDARPERQSDSNLIGVKSMSLPIRDGLSALNLNSFLDMLTSDEIEVGELVGMYNNYFGTTVTSIGFGKLKGINTSFEKRRAKIKGKTTTLYKKL